jgi:hypothetical protein
MDFPQKQKATYTVNSPYLQDPREAFAKVFDLRKLTNQQTDTRKHLGHLSHKVQAMMLDAIIFRCCEETSSKILSTK